MRTFLLPLSFLVILSACDPGTGYTRALQNNTDKVIKVEFYHQSVRGYPTGPVWIEPASISTLFVYGHIGSNPEPVEPMYRIDSVHITTDGAIIIKDMMLSDNWEVKTRKHGRSYDHAYIFTVNPGDLKK